MPPNILKAKELKQATDEKANVIEKDDEADRDQRYVEPGFPFEADPDDSFFEEDDGEGVHLAQDTNEPVIDDSAVTDSLVAGASTAPSHASARSEFKELLASPLVSEGLEAFARTPRPKPLRADRTTYTSVSAAGFSKTRKPTANSAASNASATEKLPAVPSRFSGKRADNKKAKYQNVSNRLGEGNLGDFRDTISAKRVLEDGRETLEASYAKAKLIRAARSTTAFKTKLAVSKTQPTWEGVL
ncbi:unnamed protein product [Phytophthora fragariaefolia]|uniref:Unnamed protein product n=1 Tax=Phytophthora fragariaefolia TaxID=1490495 RepID=A0A9W7D3Z6_9STRA|nr:unnamed protein product [Phytophthora fragariaefolia]